MEVVTSVQGRRSWTQEQKFEIVKQTNEAWSSVYLIQNVGALFKGEHQRFDFSNVQLEELEQELPSWDEPVFGVATNARSKTIQTSQLDLKRSYLRTPGFLLFLNPT